MTFTPDIIEKIVIAVFGAAVGSVGTFVGVLIKNYFDSKALRRNELRGRVTKIEELIRHAEDDAIEYWRKDPGAAEFHELEVSIKKLRKQIGHEISHLDKAGFPCVEASSEAIVNFNFAISGDDFEVKNRAAQPFRHERISSAANGLIDILRDALKII